MKQEAMPTNNHRLTDEEAMRLCDEMDRLGPKDFGTGNPVKSPTTVYRVEMPNGNGPYNSGLPNSMEIYRFLCNYDQPFNCAYLANLNREACGVSDHRFYKAHGDASYCCDSMDSIYRWFPLAARKYLAKYGAKIVQYRIPTGEPLAICGNGECVFNKKTAKRICELPITTVQ